MAGSAGDLECNFHSDTRALASLGGETMMFRDPAGATPSKTGSIGELPFDASAMVSRERGASSKMSAELKDGDSRSISARRFEVGFGDVGCEGSHFCGHARGQHGGFASILQATPQDAGFSGSKFLSENRARSTTLTPA